MNAKILVLLLLGISFLFLGCAKRGDGAVQEETPEGEAPADGEVSEEEQELADLFQIDTDKPLEDEGYGVGTPSAQE